MTAVERVYLVNSTIRINCSLNDSNQRANTTDIVWTFDGEVLNVTTSQLVIENAQFEDSGVYECKVDGHSQDIRWDVKVGLPPTKAKNMRCNSYDFSSMNCSWTNGGFTNLETRHVLQYSEHHFLHVRDIINYQKKENCENVSRRERISANFYVRVNSSNALAVGGIQSDGTQFRKEEITIVTPIRSPIVTNVTFTSLQVSWQPSEEYQCYPNIERSEVSYLVNYTLENTQDWHAEELHRSKHQLTIGGLQANSVYTIAITVKVDKLKSEEIRLLGRTKETAPEAGVSLDLLCSRINGTNEALLSWTRFPEDKSNGKILSYDITKNYSSVITKDPNATEHRLQGLDMYSDFIVTIVARNSAGSSDVNECYIPALPRADHSAVVSTVLIIVGAVLFVVIFILAFKFYICFKKSKITEIKLPHHIQHDNFYLFGGPQRRAPCEQERYDELITQSLVEKGSESCNSTIPNGKKDPSREPIMPEPITTKVSTT